MERRNNYEIAARQAEALFLNYDQEAVIRSFGLKADDDFIYLDFVSRPYRITRKTGALERGPVWTRAGFEEVLSVYDALCYSGKPPVPSGEWVLTGALRGAAAGPSALDSAERAAWLAEHYPVFADDEFPAQLQFLWDSGALRFVHYETIFYIMGHVLNRLEEEAARLDSI